jgi:2-keto-myo-inositol isomerase
MPRFSYCLNASTIRGTPILEQIRVAAATGYAAIELWHDDIEEHLRQGGTTREIRARVEEAGLQVPTSIYLRGWHLPRGAEYDAAMVEVRQRLKHAQEVGAQHVIACPPLKEVDYALTAQRYAELVDLGLTYKVGPAMEYLGFAEELNHVSAALRVVRESGHPLGTIVIDPFHDFRGGQGSEGIAQLDGRQIAVCHFNDSPASPPAHQLTDSDRVLPGEGVVDLKRFLALVAGTGYNRWLSLELFREDLWRRDPLEVAKLGLEKMRAVCEN